ncbi:MAG TPA: methyltransferase [Candidatus Dormibacteraeota bacterium]|nr:methyltransferase [Candidatus Dormibacteraeota bacterium]
MAIAPPRRIARLGGAAVGSAVFFVFVPGVVIGLVPWWLTGWRFVDPLPFWAPMRLLGAVIVAGAVLVIVSAFVEFVVEGLGTPAPVAPPERLVVRGVYRYVRNPMYVAATAAIAGQALLLGQVGLLLYAAAVLAGAFAFVRVYEQPHLTERFGSDYEAYVQNVPGWWPRMTPWKPSR